MSQLPRVLVISHNVFSRVNAMGRTLAGLLSCVPPEQLAQLYFHTEIPTMDMCTRYFRVTDRDVLRSVFTRRAGGHRFEESDLRPDVARVRTDVGVTARVYQYARRRTPMIYRLRNTMWWAGKWRSRELDTWIREFDPQVIFFASGDYEFAYRVTLDIAERYRLPVVIYCCDDSYMETSGASSRAAVRIRHRLLRVATQVMAGSTSMLVISEKMARDYAALFDLPIRVVKIATELDPRPVPLEERHGIMYAGDLGVGRVGPLVELGRVLKAADLPGLACIDVYSGDTNPETLAQLTEENGIRFHGAVTSDRLRPILGHARYLLHVESFDEVHKRRTRYSLSTKIADSLASGACLIAYGPADIASMEYLRELDAAILPTRAEELPDLLMTFEQDCAGYVSLSRRAQKAAQEHHSREAMVQTMTEALREAVCPGDDLYGTLYCAIKGEDNNCMRAESSTGGGGRP